MSGLSTYQQSEQQLSASVGYAIRQASAQTYLTDANVAAATTVQDLIDDVNAAVVPPGSVSPAQRDTITRSLAEGAQLGDLSDARIQTCSTVAELAALTWVNDVDPDTSHLGVAIFG